MGQNSPQTLIPLGHICPTKKIGRKILTFEKMHTHCIQLGSFKQRLRFFPVLFQIGIEKVKKKLQIQA